MGSSRRACIFFLILMLVFTNITGAFPAFASQASSSRPGVDLVILLDNSNSMNTLGGKSDIDGYRFDAAAIMLNMISLFSSRVSVIVFDQHVKSYATRYDYKQLTNVAMLHPDGSSDSMGTGNRKGLTAALTGEQPSTSGGTMTGLALTEAVKVLDSGSEERKANGNQPMILLLADGKISPRSDEKNRSKIISEQNDLVNKALEECKSKGYTLYSVILKNANNEDMDTSSISEMYRWAQTTGGTAHELADPAVLPEVFSQMFGKQIGSSMVSYQPLAEYDSINNNYYIEIDIPNKSVEEANILLQTTGLRDFRLYKPDGQEARADDHHVFKPQVGDRFTQYKIFRPTENGKWKLTFQKDEGAPDNITVNILYNYTETLEVKAVPIPGPYQKGTHLTLTAQLFKDGVPSTDQLLYREIPDENGNNVGIRAWTYLLPANSGSSVLDPNKALSKIELPASQTEDSFEKTFTIKDFKDASGKPFEKAGDFELYVHVEGAGLVRDYDPIPYEVKNQAPLVTSSSIPLPPIEINDPNDSNFGEPKTQTIDFKNYVQDKDGDPLTPAVRIDQTSIINEKEPVNDLLVTLQTQGKPGTAKLYFQATDNEQAPLVDLSNVTLPNGLEVDIEVISVIDELKAFKPKITITTEKTDKGYFEKNSTVDFEVSIEGSHKNYKITDYDLVMKVFQENADQVTGEAKQLDNLEKKNPTTWKGNLQLDDRDNHELRAELVVVAKNHKELLLNKDFNTEISTGNEAPQALTDKVSLLRSTAEVEPFTLLKQEATAPWPVILDDLFYDANVPLYDELTFKIEGEKGVVSFTEPKQIKEDPSEAFPEGRTVWTAEFTPQTPGDASFTITATDNSQASASATYNISVTSMTAAVKEKAIKYGSIALAALIALLIFLRIIKPSFKGKLTRKRDGNMHGESILPKTKATLSLSQFADDTMLRDVGLGKMNLKHVRLKAGRNHILVMLGKGNHMNATIKVGNETLSTKHKKAKLNVGREIQVSLNGHTISWLLQMNTNIKAPASSSRRGPNA